MHETARGRNRRRFPLRKAAPFAGGPGKKRIGAALPRVTKTAARRGKSLTSGAPRAMGLD